MEKGEERERERESEREREIYIYICRQASSGTAFLALPKLMCSMRLRIAPLQLFKLPHFPPRVWSA